MKRGGWKTESAIKHYIRVTCSGNVHGRKKKRDQIYHYDDTAEQPLSPEFDHNFTPCAGKD